MQDRTNRVVPIGGVTASVGAGWSGFRALRVVGKTLEDEARTLCSFELVAADGGPLPEFLPGQFLTFRLEVPDPASGVMRVVTRCYSLSDRPGLDRYRISVKRVPGGVASGFLHDAVSVGGTLQALAPSGSFVLEPGEAPVVLIAGGIGITPFLSMIHTQIAIDPNREVWLFYGVRDAREQGWHDHLALLSEDCPGFRYFACHSRPGADERAGRDYHHAGRVDITLLRLSLSLRLYHFYLCGPPGFMETLTPALEAWGVPADRLHSEAFVSPPGPVSSPAPVIGAGSEAEGRWVTFRQTGKTVPWDGSVETLLECAEAHGIDAPFGCRGGICGACQTPLVQGKVEYLYNPEFTPDPGTCLPCVVRPLTDLIVAL
ncbi:MAG: 2Fe-2S iron-sulfur cluster binding domain-containing protein [Magnetococcales bacterium]|nr:2Fe-2S iron-sulfur cluster binding domain-containing protein [Magnetococcales bacterium]